MSKPSPRSHLATLEIPLNRQDLVQPYLSSANAGWDGLIAEAYHEPPIFEGWQQEAAPEISLTLILGGPTYLEWRLGRSPQSWTGLTVRHGDLILRPNTLAPYEMRWWGLSPVPSDTVTLAIPQDAFVHTAELVAGYEKNHLILVERIGFQDPLLMQIALAVRRELEEGAPDGKLFAQCAAQLISLHLLRHYTSLGDISATTPSPHILTRTQLQRVIACIQDQLDHDLTLEVLAEQTGFSPSHFARLFRQTTNETPHQFVLRLRLDYAKQLLATTDLSLAHIAGECGFADQSAFTRAFKRAVGATPGTYRRERVSCARLDQNRTQGQDGRMP